jgi:hypothetical protein
MEKENKERVVLQMDLFGNHVVVPEALWPGDDDEMEKDSICDDNHLERDRV